jgi:hypothetical protein
MEAKEIKWCPQHGYPLPCDKCGLGLFEAGKQEGIKEVVDWANGYCTEHISTGYTGGNNRLRKECPRCWQAQVKEWLGENK